MKRVSQTNTLRRGELSKTETAAPMTKAYFQGCEEVVGFDIQENGLVPMRVPVATNEKPFTYHGQGYRGTAYIRNTSRAGASVEWSDTPTESAMLFKTLANKVAEMTLAGELRAHPADPGASDYLKYRESGKWDTDGGNGLGKLIDGSVIDNSTKNSRTLIITRPTTIFRAFFPEPALGENAPAVSGWGVHGKRRRKRYTYSELGGIKSGEDNWEESVSGVIRGSGYLTAHRTAGAVLYNDHVELSQWLEVYSLTLAPGIYEFTQDIWLVGTPKMFKEAPQGRTYAYSHQRGGAKVNLSMTEDRTWCDQADALVLAWGSSTAYSSAWANPAYTLISSIGTGQFWFTSKTRIIGSRRFGPCSVEADTESFGATKVGVMGGDDLGRTLNTGTAVADDPYAVKVAGGVVWFEEVRDGILIGTPSAEYLLAGPQVNPATGGASLQRISAVGAPGKSDDTLSQSANLAGDVFYVSRYGITTLDFSNEGQVYLPRNFEFKGRRFEGLACTSLAPALAEQCLYLSFSDGSLWKLWPAQGALALVPLVLPAGSKLLGVVTRDGQTLLVIQKSNNSRVLCEVAQARANESYLRTTAFGRGPGSRAQVKRLVVTGVDLRAGDYRVEGKLWTGLPLSGDERTNGFTGSKDFFVSDRPAALGRGKTVEFRFVFSDDQLQNPGTLSAISVEMEV